ncbi:MAG: 50S ribosome-binding GTPase [archaeon]|nr:50S ribosome-binding GTPase [archaeon]MCR4323842.1 50S ribosome-binding GTPase [Nanoarchaeota archaeon]
MASTNQSPFYQRAEEEFHKATTDEERISCLEIMIKECPKHKSSENMLKNLTNRLKKLNQSIEKQKKAGKSSKTGVKKADMQCVLTGFPNTGKSTIFKILTGLNPKISPHPFTTHQPQLGTFKFEDAPIQIIDAPAFPSHDKNFTNGTDTLLFVVDELSQIPKAEEFLYRTKAKIILIFNKEDILSENEKRKIKATLDSKYKKYNYHFFSQKPSIEELNNLKKEIFQTFPIIRVYTKEPKKEASKEPMILKVGSTFKDAAEKILKGISKKIKRARIWGPSSRFGGQIIGLEHILKDKDVIEFQTR